MSFSLESNAARNLIPYETATAESIELFGNIDDATAYSRLSAIQSSDTKSDLVKALLMLEWHDLHKDDGKAVWQTVLDKAGLKRSYGAQYVKVGEVVRKALDTDSADDLVDMWITNRVSVSKLYELRGMAADTVVGMYLSGTLNGTESQKDLRELNDAYKRNRANVDAVLARDGDATEVVEALNIVSAPNIDKDAAQDLEPVPEDPIVYYHIGVRTVSHTLTTLQYVAPGAIKSLKKLTTIYGNDVQFAAYLEHGIISAYGAHPNTPSYLYYVPETNEYAHIDFRAVPQSEHEEYVKSRIATIQQYLESGEIDVTIAGKQIAEATQLPVLMSYKDIEKALA